MMLQTVHKNDRALQASSLYCVWTPRDGNPDSPLVAIWVDSAMRAFPGVPEEAVDLSPDEPGGQVLIRVT